MAIRFSMSDDTSLINTATSTDKRTKNPSLEKEYFVTKQAQNNLKEARGLQTQTKWKSSTIQVMRLFYEMKQEFPNIPDNVVNQHVIDNIHDPENCKARLNSEKDSFLIPVQSYPQQLLRVLNRESFLKKLVEPKNSALLANAPNNKCNYCSNKHLHKNGCNFVLINEAVGFLKHNNSCECKQISTSEIKDMRSGVCSVQITTGQTYQNRKHDLLEKEKLQLQQLPQRPTTLKLKTNAELKGQPFQVNNQDLSGQQVSKNEQVRGLISSTLNPPVQKFEQSINTATTIQNPTLYTDLSKSEILVNVSLSPNSHRSRVGGTQRHQSAINVHPELPFTRNFESATSGNHKSYTSVNFVLRQPSLNPQSLIDITVGSNITYSSSSYHARLGYQNNYQITVSDECGVFSAFRISPSSTNSPRVETIDTDVCDECPDDFDVDSGNCSSLQNSIVKATNSCGQSDAQTIIMRQHKQKERILIVLRKNKNKLSLVHKEVDFAIQIENTDGISEILDSEINKLRYDCQTMLNEIENSRKCGLREDGIPQSNSIKSRQAHSFPKYKAIRYPASTNCLQNQQQLFPNEENILPRQLTIDDSVKNSSFGAGD